MATRSTIAVDRGDGVIESIYCHWDGYLSHNGKILLEHYQSAEKVNELIALGDLSVLGEKIGVKHPFDSTEFPGMCAFYARDRGEKDVEPVKDTYENDDAFRAGGRRRHGSEYTYLFREGVWWVWTWRGEGFRLLTDVLAGESEDEN